MLCNHARQIPQGGSKKGCLQSELAAVSEELADPTIRRQKERLQKGASRLMDRAMELRDGTLRYPSERLQRLAAEAGLPPAVAEDAARLTYRR